MKDEAYHKGKRNKLVKELISKGIRDEKVLRAIGRIPRHLFINSSFEDFAYQDKAFPIAAGQTISQPYTVARQSELLEVEPGDKVLEIGTGSGYQAAVLAQMGCKLYTVERQKELFDITRPLLQKLGYKLNMFFGDGYKGLPQHAPFKGIIVTAGAPYIPKPLVEQLAPGAKLVIPVGEDVQTMKVVVKSLEGKVTLEEHGTFRFVPMLNHKN